MGSRHLKAQKLAALNAVGRDAEDPVVTYDDCMWATLIVVQQTEALIAKFERDETGVVAGNENKQLNAVIRCLHEYFTQPFERFANYGVTRKMHESGAFPQSYLSRRVLKMPAFADDKIGATNALHRAIKNLTIADDIRELPTSQTVELFGTQAKTFMPSKPERFFEGQK